MTEFQTLKPGVLRWRDEEQAAYKMLEALTEVDLKPSHAWPGTLHSESL